MIGRLRQLSEPKLRQQAGIEKSHTPVERDSLVQWVRNLWFGKSFDFQISRVDCTYLYNLKYFNFWDRSSDQLVGWLFWA